MPIRLRFLLVSGVFLAGLGIIGYVAIRDVEHTSDVFSQVARESIDQVKLSDQIRANLPDLRALELEYIMTTDPHQQPAVLQRMETRREALRQVMNHYEFDGATDGQSDCVSCHQVFGRYSQSHSQMKDLVSLGRQDEALAVYQSSESDYSSLLAEAESFRQNQYASALAYNLQGSSSAEEARNILIGCFAAAVVLLLIIGYALGGYVHRRLQQLMEGTRRIMAGNLNDKIDVRGGDEFGQLAIAFNSMTDSLRNSRTENVRLHEVAIKMREERINLLSDGLKRAVEAQENERQRVARELHDGIGQALTGLQLGLGRLEMDAKSPRTREAASSLRDLSVSTLQEIRDLARDLRPGMLDEMGLEPTLRNYVKGFSERAEIPIELAMTGLASRLAPELEVTVFRIVQEGLANMAKHSRAEHAWVTLSVEGGILRVTVRDDGVGFDVEEVRGHHERSLGLSGMEERCRFTNGRLEIASEPGMGTTLTCTWRLPAEVVSASDGQGTSPDANPGRAAIPSSSGGSP